MAPGLKGMNQQVAMRGSVRKLPSGHASAIVIAFLVALMSGAASAQSGVNAAGAQAATVHVDATRGHSINSFDPDSALGSSIDVLSRTSIDKVYTPHVLQESLSAGWGPITYRNNTELRMAAWHWTENGTWSDAAHRSGYFTGSTELKDPIKYILAYAVPTCLDDRILEHLRRAWIGRRPQLPRLRHSANRCGYDGYQRGFCRGAERSQRETNYVLRFVH